MNPNTFKEVLADSNIISKQNRNKKNDGSVKELDQGQTLMRVLFRQV